MLLPRRVGRLQQPSLKILQQRNLSRSLSNNSYPRKNEPEPQRQGEEDAEHRHSEAGDEPQKCSGSDQQQPGSLESKSTVQADEELRENLDKMVSSDGGLAGVELEGGKPVGVNRGVRNNMFRLI